VLIAYNQRIIIVILGHDTVGLLIWLHIALGTQSNLNVEYEWIRLGDGKDEVIDKGDEPHEGWRNIALGNQSNTVLEEECCALANQSTVWYIVESVWCDAVLFSSSVHVLCKQGQTRSFPHSSRFLRILTHRLYDVLWCPEHVFLPTLYFSSSTHLWLVLSSTYSGVQSTFFFQLYTFLWVLIDVLILDSFYHPTYSGIQSTFFFQLYTFLWLIIGYSSLTHPPPDVLWAPEHVLIVQSHSLFWNPCKFSKCFRYNLKPYCCPLLRIHCNLPLSISRLRFSCTKG